MAAYSGLLVDPESKPLAQQSRAPAPRKRLQMPEPALCYDSLRAMSAAVAPPRE